ncbi:MAG TPA: N-acetylmuramoyl-L-alanine amidase [Candidatus Dormibacteraeota bacterium]|nr:N-acetylmuramoyl-L-alanine amidase [Candidatus Dormibacteraeota bacterium]
MPIVLAVVLVDRACAGAGVPGDAGIRGVSAAGSGGPGFVYAAGACQAQGPTGTSRSRTVFIDPGHGGPDPGVTARPSARESAAALAVATQLARQLRADGYRVVLSRTGDTSVRRFGQDELTDGALDPDQVRQDLQARVRCANDSRAQALLSIHFNGYDDESVGGSQTIYDDARPFSDQSAKLADSVQRALVEQLRLEDRGVITDDALDAPTLSDQAASYGHLVLLGPAQAGWLDRGTTMPGVLVEPLFLTRPAEQTIATSSAGQRRVAQALAAGLERYLGSVAAQ